MYALSWFPDRKMITMVNETFGTLLRRLRTQRGITLEILAEKSNVTYVAIGDWERGKRNPKRVNVEAVANALEVDAGDLLMAAGFLPGDSGSPDEIIRVSDPGDVHTFAMYDGLDAPDKEIARTMIAGLAKANRKKSIGGGND